VADRTGEGVLSEGQVSVVDVSAILAQSLLPVAQVNGDASHPSASSENAPHPAS
jgi:hypothetical protein